MTQDEIKQREKMVDTLKGIAAFARGFADTEIPLSADLLKLAFANLAAHAEQAAEAVP